MKTDGWQSFINLCIDTKNQAMLSELFDFIFTAEEQSSVASRCLIVKELLEQQQPQREISQRLQVSIAKITRGSNELKRISPSLKNYLKKQLCQKGSQNKA